MRWKDKEEGVAIDGAGGVDDADDEGLPGLAFRVLVQRQHGGPVRRALEPVPRADVPHAPGAEERLRDPVGDLAVVRDPHRDDRAGRCGEGSNWQLPNWKPPWKTWNTIKEISR
mgnify:CR=1 FL=1